MKTTYLKFKSGFVMETENPELFPEGNKITRREYEETKRKQAIKSLRKIFKPGSTVFTTLKSVSSSGMYRHISVLSSKGGEVSNVSALVSDATGMKFCDDGSIGVGGCGMDMGFHIVYNLSRTLYQDRFYCIGEKCQSNDHNNGDKDRTKHKHSDGGYALKHRWV